MNKEIGLRKDELVAEFLRWKSKYSEAVGELIWAFEPEGIPPVHGLPTIAPYGYEPLGVFALYPPDGIDNRGTISEEHNQLDGGFVGVVENFLGREISSLAEFQRGFLKDICESYPLKRIVEDLLSEILVFADACERGKSGDDEKYKLPMAERMSEAKLNYRRRDVSKSTGEALVFQKTFARCYENSEFFPRECTELEIYRDLLVEKVDESICRLYKSMLIPVLEMMNRDMYLILRERATLAYRIPVFNGDEVEAYRTGLNRLRGMKLKVKYEKRVDDRSWWEFWDYHDQHVETLPGFSFVGEDDREYYLFTGSFEESQVIGSGSERPYIQLDIHGNKKFIYEHDIARALHELNGETGTDVYASINLTRLFWTAMGVRLTEMLSVTRSMLSCGEVGLGCMGFVKRVLGSGLFDLLSEELITGYNGDCGSTRKVLYWQIIRRSSDYFIRRDERLARLGRESTFDYLGDEFLKKMGSGYGRSISDDGLLEGSSYWRENLQNATKKRMEELGRITVLYGESTRRELVPEFIELADETSKWRTVGEPGISGACGCLILDMPRVKVLTNGVIPLPFIRDMRVLNVEIECNGRYVRGLWCVDETGREGVQMPVTYAGKITSVRVEYAKVRERELDGQIVINDRPKRIKAIEGLIDELMARPELGFRNLGRRLTNLFVNGDMVSLSRFSEVVAEGIEYVFDGRKIDKGRSVLDRLAAFADGGKIGMQCNPTAYLMEYFLKRMFSGEDLKIERVGGLGVSLRNVKTSFGEEGNKFMFRVSADERHALVRVDTDGEINYVDATGIAGRFGNVGEDGFAEIVSKDNGELNGREDGFVGLIDKHYRRIERTLGSMYSGKGLVRQDQWKWVLAGLPKSDPLRSLVAVLLRFRDGDISRSEALAQVGKMRELYGDNYKALDRMYGLSIYKDLTKAAKTLFGYLVRDCLRELEEC